MANNQSDNGVREGVLDLLLTKVREDTYPSATMLDVIEKLVTPDDKAAYAEVLLRRSRPTRPQPMFLVRRLLALT